MTRLRVLHVYKDYPPVLGGIENHLKLTAEGLAERGVDVTVLATNTTRRTTVAQTGSLRVIKAGRMAEVASTPLSLAFFNQMARAEADITHLHFPYPPGEVAYLLRGRSPRLVISYHSDIVRQQKILRFYRPLLKRVLQRADRLIVTSRAYAESSRFLVPFLDKCTVIPLGIQAGRFQNIDRRTTEQFRLRFGTPIILFVGHLRYYKGLEYLVTAMRGVSGQLVLAGTGKGADEYRTMALEAGIGERVHFAGTISDDDLPSLYASADVFVLPSSERSEAFGIVQLEAMASGIPVVCTELGTGTSVVNRHSETGLVVPPRDPDALAVALNRLLSSPALRRSMGEAGRKRVASEFTSELMLERIMELYRQIL
jgi:glycosyltransferase involved in cell wall biosynthesis